jgi:hypothetical protein
MNSGASQVNPDFDRHAARGPINLRDTLSDTVCATPHSDIQA